MPEQKAVSHYFSDNENADFNPFKIEIQIGGKTQTLQSSKGVFSANGIDKATAALLKFLKTERGVKFLPKNPGRILDLGCGWGPIALELGLMFPKSEVIAVDVNRIAIELTNLNAESLKLKNVIAKMPEEVADSVKFDLIISNPPIRIGKENLFNLLEKWLKQLADDGTALMVIQKNLGSDSVVKWINASLVWGAEKISSSGGNSLIFVHHRGQ